MAMKVVCKDEDVKDGDEEKVTTNESKVKNIFYLNIVYQGQDHFLTTTIQVTGCFNINMHS